MSAPQIRVRFAPSPTGHLHVGSVRVALFNWLFARHHGGTYLLRIEDTDVARSKKEYVDSQIESLRWMDLLPDEEMVFQLSYLDTHKQTLSYLLTHKLAYPCFCPPTDWQENEELYQEGVAVTKKVSCPCRDKEWRDSDLAAPHAVRFRVPDDLKRVVFEDEIHGSIVFAREQIDDFIIQRSDGIPTYNFCVVVDDITMRITHVIRGEDHISNTPKQILLYQALGKPIPHFAHLPLILGPSGNRLSKRDAAVALEEYRKMGFLPDAMTNYLVRLGWSHGDQEIFTKEELIRLFSLKQVGKKGSIFDIKKLEWVNGLYIRKATATDLLRAMDDMQEGTVGTLSDLWTSAQLKELITLYKERVNTLRELYTSIADFAQKPVHPDLSLISQWRTANTPLMLADLISFIESCEPSVPSDSEGIVSRDSDSLGGGLTHDQMIEKAKEIAKKYNEKLVGLAQPLRLALTGTIASPGVFDLMAIIGKKSCLERIGSFLVLLKQ